MRLRTTFVPHTALAFMCLVMIGCSVPVGPDREQTLPMAISLEWSLPAQRDNGEPLGTLFRLEDNNGEPVCEVGFNWSFSSRVIGPNRMLQLWCRSRLEVRSEDLGIPDEVSRRMSLALFQDRITELTTNHQWRNGQWQQISTDTTTDGLRGSVSRRAAGAAASYSGLTQSVQQIGDAEMRFVYWTEHHPSRAIYKGRTVLEIPADLAAGMFAFDRIWISPISGGELWHCRFRPDEDESCGSIEKLAYPGGSAYALAAWQDHVWIADSHGKIWSIRSNLAEGEAIELAFDSSKLEPAFPGEFYAFAVFGDSLLAGHYPTGQIVGLNRSNSAISWQPFGPILGQRSSSRNPLTTSEIEVQALLVHAGRLWAGVYPWGELYTLSADGTPVQKPFRFFRGARSNVPPFPFSDRLLRAAFTIHPGATGRCSYDGSFTEFLEWGGRNEISVHKCLDRLGGYISKTDWGQRVPSLTLGATGLFAATGNRMNHSWLASRDRNIITPSQLKDYGRIWRIDVPGTYARHFSWPKRGVYPVSMEQSEEGPIRMKLLDGVVDLPLKDPASIRCIRIGRGSFGTAPGLIKVSSSSIPACA
ncbi:MAG: hypothetical protein FJ194_03600 [Gammaproteobacteria bacterium]|nr:hypothetical protein [Gammaproteobacteria bacterium]